MTRPANPELVNELLTITTALIADKGSSVVTMREIAERAGVTPTTIHYYFNSKRGLFEAAKLRAVAELDAAVAAALEPAAGTVAHLRQAATAFLHWSVTNPHGFALIFEALPAGAELSDELGRHSRTTFLRLRETFRRGRANGELACDDADARAIVGFAALFGLVDLFLNKRLPPQHLADSGALLEDAMLVFLAACVPTPIMASAPAPVVPIGGPRALSDDVLDELAAAGPEPFLPSAPFPPGGLPLL
jgi:AcrR family transcriptional regulator